MRKPDQCNIRREFGSVIDFFKSFFYSILKIFILCKLRHLSQNLRQVTYSVYNVARTAVLGPFTILGIHIDASKAVRSRKKFAYRPVA